MHACQDLKEQKKQVQGVAVNARTMRFVNNNCLHYKGGKVSFSFVVKFFTQGRK
jgi:hypothetical protein